MNKLLDIKMLEETYKESTYLIKELKKELILEKNTWTKLINR